MRFEGFMKTLKNYSIMLLALLTSGKSVENISLPGKNNSEIIIIYNAESGIFNALSDYMHKIVSPETYQCNLCALTYGNLGMEGKWKNYLKKLKLPVSFKYKDQLQNKTGLNTNISFPVIMLAKNGDIIELVSTAEINNSGTVDELITLMDKKLKIYQ